jgi:hypothetical protein
VLPNLLLDGGDLALDTFLAAEQALDDPFPYSFATVSRAPSAVSSFALTAAARS